MNRLKSVLFLFLLMFVCFMTCGCTNDGMDNIEIVVTNYPNEYIVKNLYGDHATITSIYPDGVDINNYKIGKKQLNDYSKKDLFVYNGLLEKERDLAVNLLSINPNLKIIDTAYVLETDYSPEELWLNPSSLLMMTQNVRLSLNEYITNTYLIKEVDEAYETLKITLSELDADYRFAVESTEENIIIVADSALKYLEKFGLTVICIDTDATQKTLVDAENYIKNNNVNYIFTFKDLEDNDNVKFFLENYPSIQKLELHKLDNISDEERSNKEDYKSLILQNLELIKKELYQ